MQVPITSVGNVHSEVNSAVDYTLEQNNGANISNIPDVSNLLPEHQFAHVHNNTEQSTSYQGSIDGLQTSYTGSLPMQSGIYEKPNQNYGTAPTQSYGNAPTQSYGRAPTQTVQNLGNFPVQHDLTTNFDQMNRLNEPNQVINAVNTNSNQFTQRNDMSNADSN